MHKKLRNQNTAQVVVSDRVKFQHRDREYFGYVCKKGRKVATVLCDDHREFDVPYGMIAKIPGARQQPVQSHADTLRLQFHVNDRVRFDFKGRALHGTIARLNPKRAHVVCEDEKELQVPYTLLTLISTRDDPHRSAINRDEAALHAIAERAREWMAQHALRHWSFQFDHGTRRAGCCHYATQVISLSYEYAKHDSEQGIRDTLLHEIAHALVGKNHHHDAVWRAKAVEIGCSGKRLHDVQFTPPKYIVRCRNDCWVATAETAMIVGLPRRKGGGEAVFVKNVVESSSM
jgi:predicted SprT family Zn-dependent metalloprotease